MKFYIALLVCALAAWTANAGWECKQEEKHPGITSAHGADVKINIPCKYAALREQECGKWTIRLTPGVTDQGHHYRLHTIWMGLKHKDMEGEWFGRLSNIRAVKFWNFFSDVNKRIDLFKQKSESGPDTSEVLTFDRDTANGLNVARSIDGNFTFTAAPYDNRYKEFRKSNWHFQCHVGTAADVAKFPAQLCGGEILESKSENLNTTFGSEKKHKKYKTAFTNDELVMNHTFRSMDRYIIQVDPLCQKAEDILRDNCDGKEADALEKCSDMLASKGHRRCVNRYSCSPMDTFVACVEWVCGGMTNQALCAQVGETIDNCREFSRGDLTATILSKKCYPDFHINPNPPPDSDSVET